MRRLALRLMTAILIMAFLFGSTNTNQVYGDNDISLNALGVAYVQDFDSLASSGSSDALPQGWSMTESGVSADNLYNAGTGSQSAGNIYSYGVEGSTERALGGVLSTDLIPLFGASFSNHTGGFIQSLVISYTGEQWRCGRTSRRDYITFEYSTDATSITSGSWTQVSELEFSTLFTGRVGAIDGNNSSYRQLLSATITGLSIENGASFWIRWSDHDAISGNDDGLAVDDLSITPFGVDLAPEVISISPADQSSEIALDETLSVTFSEGVDLSSGWYSLTCSSSGTHTASIQGGPEMFELIPDHPFDHSETCTFTIDASQVHDRDTVDPPDSMAQNESIQFTTVSKPDDPPMVTHLQPQNGAAAVDPLSTIQLAFSEAVDLDENWFSLVCSKSGNHQASLAENETNITLTPVNPLAYDEECSLTIFAQKVHDQDLSDPPDQMPADILSTFHTLLAPDEAPFVTTFSPANGQTSVETDSNLSITFSEQVNLGTDWFELDCSQSGTHAATLSGANAQYALDPVANFVYDEECVFVVKAQKVNDADANDPPDAMNLDQTIHFQIESNPDTKPAVVYSIPADQSSNISPNTTITLDFNEPVSILTDQISLVCTSSGFHGFELSGTTQTIIIDPVVSFEPNETCNVNLKADAVSDQDAIDPPDGLATDFQIEFTIAPPADAAPVVLSTSPADNATNVDITYRQMVTFSEPVRLATGWVDLQCSKSGSQPLFLSEGPTTYKVEADHNLQFNETCQVTVFADKVTDEDTADPPDNMPVDYSLTFHTMADPDVPPYPSVLFGDGTFPQPGWVLYSGFHEISIEFNKDVLHDASDDAVNNPQNYRLIESGANNEIETNDCDLLNGDDQLISIDQIEYDPNNRVAQIQVNQNQNLPNGDYRLILCGAHTIRDLDGNAINNGTNTLIDFQVAVAAAPETPDPSATPVVPGEQPSTTDAFPTIPNKNTQTGPIIPLTGFMPGVSTLLPVQSVIYQELGDLWLEIPSMKVELPITGVPNQNGNWDVTWLGQQAGWLEGSAFPTALGNSVLTGHVWDAFNQPGPFFGFDKLEYDDVIVVHHFDTKYYYRVREVLSVKPENLNAMLKHQNEAWLTLVTCQGFNEKTQAYERRVLIRAVLVETN